jgi:glycosyltransferase involved in cell wall biosynthesis
MNLLILTNNLNRASFRQRIGVYLDTLRRNGIDYEVAQLPSGTLARRKLFKKAADFDGVFLHKKKLNFVDAFWLRRYSRKVIYNFDDAIMYSDKNPERDSRSHLIPFRRSVKLADIVIAGNSYLAEHARKFNARVEVLPTGLNAKAYRVDTKSKNDGKIRLVWIGSKSTLKYLAEIKPALEEIGSRFDNAILRIICDDFFDLQNMEVEKHRWSEETQVIDLATSDFGLAPLPDNRFTRGKCGFKILQYAAAELPVIASPVGVNAEYVCDGVTGFHAINASQWIDKISELIENAELRKRMGQEGNVQVQRFDLSIVGKQLYKLVERCLEGVAP